MDATRQPAAPVLGAYRLAGLIGAGTVGAVHRAIDTAGSGGVVALKVVPLNGSRAERDETRSRLQAEAAASRRLQHPGIVRVHGSGDDGARAWIAMELLPGCNLTRYASAARRLPDAVVLRIGERLADALAHAHAAGVLHRDVKPANVVVDWAQDRIVLTDFGIARLADGERTRTGRVLATPAYAAPEQLAGADASAASDLYALGVLLFELLTGRLPHASTSLGELLRRVATEPAPGLLTLRPDAPAALAAVLAALLGKRAAERPRDAAALSAQLRTLRLTMEP